MKNTSYFNYGRMGGHIYNKTYDIRCIFSLRREKANKMPCMLQSVSCVTENICCKSRNLPNTDVRNYSIDLR